MFKRYGCITGITCLMVTLVLRSLPAQQSPYSASWLKDGALTGGVIATVFLASVIDDSLRPLTMQEISGLNRLQVNSFDRSATYNYSETLAKVSDAAVIMCLASPLTMLVDKNIRNDVGTLSLMYAQTVLLATFVPSLAKGSVDKMRPYAYHPDVPLDKKLDGETRRSFFSGHTTLAFASAIFTATVFSDYFPNSPWKPALWAGVVAAASAVGYLRYASGAHFPSDAIMGALVGSAIGYIIPSLHRISNENLQITPVMGTQTIGLAVRWNGQ